MRFLSDIERARYCQHVEETRHHEQRSSILVQTAIEEGTSIEEPRYQIRHACERFRKSARFEDQRSKGVQTGKFGGLGPSAAALEQKTRAERSRNDERED